MWFLFPILYPEGIGRFFLFRWSLLFSEYIIPRKSGFTHAQQVSLLLRKYIINSKMQDNSAKILYTRAGC